MDTNKLELEASRGYEAEQVLAMPLVKGAHEAIERAILEALATCPLRDKEGQHELVMKLKANRDHAQLFKTYVETGHMARLQLTKLERLKRRFST